MSNFHIIKFNLSKAKFNLVAIFFKFCWRKFIILWNLKEFGFGAPANVVRWKFDISEECCQKIMIEVIPKCRNKEQFMKDISDKEQICLLYNCILV